MKKQGRPRFVKGYLEPIKTKVKRRRFCVFDIESKEGDSKTIAGFTRPFLVGFFDPRRVKDAGGGYLEFRDEPHLFGRSAWERRHIDSGGCIDKLMSVILTRAYSNHVFYSHNGGNFDMLFLLTWLREHRESDNLDFEVVPIQSTIQVLRVWRVPENPDDSITERWEFLDSMRLIPMGLERACKAFGLPRGKVQHNLNTHEDDPSWSIYLKQDCVALATVMALVHDMVEDKLGGEVGITTPSTSMKLFLRRFLGQGNAPAKVSRWQHWRECYKGDACVGCAHDWVRRGYYGGRTEIFRMYGESLHYFDLNSSYAAAMREEMPIGERFVENGGLDWRRHRSPGNPEGNYSGFAECLVYIPEDCPIPPLPHRDKKSGKLMFPTGHIRGVWSLEELALLTDPLVGGHIVEVKKTVWFRLQPLFGEMIEVLYQLRDKTRPDYDPGLSEMAKLLMNSLYGKFAMRQERSSVVFAQDVAAGKCFLCREDLQGRAAVCPNCEGSKPATSEPDGDVWYQHHKVDASYIIPHVSAHITALARVRLWGHMKKAIELGGKIYYTDTDSIITDIMLPTSPKLGDLKDEYPGELLEYLAVQPKVYVIAPMLKNADIKRKRTMLAEAWEDAGLDASTLDTDYQTLPGKGYRLEDEHKVTMKGFPQKMRTRENLNKLRDGETLAWEQLEKVRSLAREGFKRPPRMAGAVSEDGKRRVKKSFQSDYQKRIVDEMSGTTKAIVLDERASGWEE